MARFLRNFDALSFWLGVLAGALLWFLLGRLRPTLKRIAANLREQAQTSRQEKLLNDRTRLGNDTLRYCQGLHLAASLFSLDEIIIPPRVLAPAPLPMAYEPAPSEDITDWAIPYTLDFPELASFYGAPSFSIARALQGNSNLVIVAEAGRGKTTALAHLATQVVREDPELGELSTAIPLMVHAADLALPLATDEEPINLIGKATQTYIRSIPSKRLPNVIEAAFEQNRAILLLDGLDELSPKELDDITSYLESLLYNYPKLRIVTSASPTNLVSLPDLGFFPLSLASWKTEQRSEFITKWGNLWNKFVAEPENSEPDNLEPLLIAGWLYNNSTNLTPLELTLKVWSAFAGDSRGPKSTDAIESYIQRLTFGQPDKYRPALQQLASQMVLEMQSVVEQYRAERWLAGADMFAVEAEPISKEDSEIDSKPTKKGRAKAHGALPDLVSSGILHSRVNGQVTISHPIFTAYLASQDLIETQNYPKIFSQPEWVGKREAIHYLAVMDQQAFWMQEIIDNNNDDPLNRSLLAAAQWLRDVPDNPPWVINVMRNLAALLQDEKYTLGLRARALSALVFSSNSGVTVLMRQMLKSENPITRQLACLGCGILRDQKSVNEIKSLINHHSPNVSRAALLTLIAIGDQTSMESVAYNLLHGDESLRRAAAEALANHPEEGHPTLQEGSQLEEPAVRRAVVFGLGRIHETWSISILENMRADDTQWVVQDAATQTLEAMTNKHPRTPEAIPELTHTAWLIGFAGEKGMGVSPGRPAYDLLYKALREGDEDQRLAALHYLRFKGDRESAVPLLKTYQSSTSDVRDSAYEALHLLTSKGIELPPSI
jgi:HEAT repeat protein